MATISMIFLRTNWQNYMHARTHFPWLFLFSLTFPWPALNSLTFPGFPGEWPPYIYNFNRGFYSKTKTSNCSVSCFECKCTSNTWQTWRKGRTTTEKWRIRHTWLECTPTDKVRLTAEQTSQHEAVIIHRRTSQNTHTDVPWHRWTDDGTLIEELSSTKFVLRDWYVKHVGGMA